MVRRILRLLVVWVAAAGLLLGGVVAQVDRSEQARIEAELAEGQRVMEARRAEIARITEALGSTEARLRQQIAERDRVAAQIGSLETQRAQLQLEVAGLEAEVVATEERVAGLEADLGVVMERVRGLLLNLHRQRASGYGTVLGRADSFHELLLQQRFVSMMAAQDVAVVQELDALLSELAQARRELEAQIAGLRARETELAANTVALEGTRLQLDVLIADLRSTEDGQRAEQRSLLEAQEAMQAQLLDLDRALAREIARLEAEEAWLRQQAQNFVDDRARQAELEAQADQARAQRDNLVNPTPSAVPGFINPLESSVLVARFGDNGNSFISLRASSPNAAVRAMRGGTVVVASLAGANIGYMVAVRHDDGVTTAYTNLRQPVVEVNQVVPAGQVLGYLGGSSLVPADMLNLYLQRSGVFVDPASLLGL